MICRDCANGKHCANTCDCQHRTGKWFEIPVKEETEIVESLDLDPQGIGGVVIEFVENNLVVCNRHQGQHTIQECAEWAKLVDEREGFK